jgi:hypothetical protein
MNHCIAAHDDAYLAFSPSAIEIHIFRAWYTSGRLERGFVSHLPHQAWWKAYNVFSFFVPVA